MESIVNHIVIHVSTRYVRLRGNCSDGCFEIFRRVGCHTTGIPAHGAIDMF